MAALEVGEQVKYARRRDANESLIIAALRAVGAAVQQLDGDGVPDLAVQFGGVLAFVEVKNSNTNRNATHTPDGLTPSQVKWFANWREQGGVVHVVTNVDEALRAVGARRDEK